MSVSDFAPDAPAPVVLVGRDRERQTLLRLLDEASAGNGRFALISGPAGIGKTALVRDLIDVAVQRGERVWFGACYDSIATAPYEPWHAALTYDRDPRSPASPDLLSLLGTAVPGFGPIESGSALVQSLLTYLTQETSARPGLLVLEDLHRADVASLELLTRVVTPLSRLPLLIVGTWREHAERGTDALATLARDPRCTRLGLSRLDERGLVDLVQLRYPSNDDDQMKLVGFLARYADGNPLFALELLRGLEQGGQIRQTGDGLRIGGLDAVRVPPLVEQLIANRLDSLNSGPRELLAAGAALGQSFSYEMWQAVTEASAGELAQVLAVAREAQVLVPTGRNDLLEFQHPLIYEVLYQQLAPSTRHELHLRAAEALLAAPAPDAHRIADHLYAAGDGRAPEWLLRAGDSAERAHAWQDAIACLRQALDAMPARSDNQPFRGWLSFRVACLLRYSDLDAARDALDEAFESALACRDEALTAYTRYLRGLLHVYAGNSQRGFADLLDALERLERLPEQERLRLNAAPGIFNADATPLPTSRFEPPTETELAGGLLPGDVDRRATVAALMAESGRLDDALDLLHDTRTASSAGRPEGEPAPTGHVLQTSAYVHALAGRPTDSTEDFDRAGRAFEDSGRPILLIQCLVNRLSVLGWPYQADRIADRRAQQAEALRLAERLGGFLINGLSHEHWLILNHFMEGRWDQVAELVAAPVLDLPGSRYHQHVYLVAAMLAREVGRVDRAREWLRRLIPDGERSEPGNTELLSTTRAMVLAADLALDAGDIETADRWLAAHARWIEWSGAVLGSAEAQLGRARLALASGDSRRAREHANLARALAVEPRQPLALCATQRFIAELEIEAGDLAAAQEHLSRATALSDNCEIPHEQIACRIVQVRLAAARGDLEIARQIAVRVRNECMDLGARRLLAELDRIDLTAPAEAAQQGADELTARELEVLERVARGLTDAEVAADLSIATRTVHAHMRSIRAKLAVGSRMAAVNVARERGLI